MNVSLWKLSFANTDFIWKMRSKDEFCVAKICQTVMEISMMNEWNEIWLKHQMGGNYRATAKWNQKMKSVMQTLTTNAMETEMVTLQCKDGVYDASCRWDENWNINFIKEYICDSSFPGVRTDWHWNWSHLKMAYIIMYCLKANV